jgi:AraC-like DNA-binding protein
MQLASRLLVEHGAKVVSVAAAVGFESEAAFSRAFKKCVGLSPDEWRRRRESDGRGAVPITANLNHMA